jgi:serine/threonine protein phosphatase PrpC
LLTGCLGTVQDPPLSVSSIGRLEPGDSVMCCSDGLWHYFSSQEIGQMLDSLPPKESCKMLIDKARQRAKGGGDNLSLVLVRVEQLGG